MRIRRHLFGLIVLVSLSAGVCQASDRPVLGPAEEIGSLLISIDIEASKDEPALGQPELIGQLLLVASAETSDSTIGSLVLTAVVAEPQLGDPVPLLSLEPQELDVSAIEPVHPNDIQDRLRQAAHLLSISGLNEESQSVLKLVSKIDEEHYERLLLTKREAELAALQTEVDRLRQSVRGQEDSTDVVVTVKFIEWSGDLPKEFHTPESARALEESIRSGIGKVVAEPKLLTSSGCTCRYQLDKSTANKIALVSGPEEPIGTRVVVTPEVQGEKIHLAIRAEYEKERSGGRVQTSLSVTPGELVVLGGLGNNDGACVIAVMAERVSRTASISPSTIK